MTNPVSRVLDCRPYFDSRSRQYPISRLLPAKVSRTKRIWGVPANVLDQGNEGRCVSFGWSGELAAAPVVANELPGGPVIDDAYADKLFGEVQAEDRAMGNNWPDGASVLAGAKAVAKRGLITEYRWAFGIDEVVDTIVAHGPVILGIPWYSSMYITDARGLVTVDGHVVGRHCIMAYGSVPNDPVFDADMIWWRNSWGPTYGVNGTGYIRTADLARLLSEDGECCVPTDRAVTVAPQTDAADVALSTAAGKWPDRRHVGEGKRVAAALRAWRAAKDLS